MRSKKELTEEEIVQNQVDMIQAAAQNYKEQMKVIAHELSMTSKHGTIIGSFREETWIELFRRIVPKKFSIANGVIIIDSKGKMSNEVDIAIFDENYTPYIMQYGSIKLIPIEAVAVVVECKSTSFDKAAVIEWTKSITRLKTDCSGIARMVQGYTRMPKDFPDSTQTDCRPIRVFAPLTKVSNKSELREYFDIVLALNATEDKIELDIPNEANSLGWWAEVLNKDATCTETQKELKMTKGNLHVTQTLKDYAIPDNSLLSLNFQLNQLLMLINNPMLFPHEAYVKLFRNPEEVIRKNK